MLTLAGAETERLLLEPWDHDAHASGNAVPEVMRHLGRAALDAGFATLSLEEVAAHVHPANARSLPAARRLGMEDEAELAHPSRDHTVKILRIACSSW